MRNRNLSPSNGFESLKWFWLLALALLLAGYLSGYFWSSHFSGELQPALASLKNLASQIRRTQSVWHTFSSIFIHNVLAAFLMMLFGIGAGIFPAIMMWLNGLLMGFVTFLMVSHAHVPAWKVIVFGLLPHGIFELTALLWASALGLQVGFAAIHSIWSLIRGGVRTASPSIRGPMSFRRELKRSFVWFPAIVVLLLIAAGIESTVTPYLIHWSGLTS